jgi:hypothetical protein
MVEDAPVVELHDSAPHPGSECTRINKHIYVWGLLSLLIATPINYVCAAISYFVAYGDLENIPAENSFLPPPMRLSFIVACCSCAIGLVSLLVPHWLPQSESGLSARRILRGVAIIGVCSVILGILGALIASGPAN